MAKKMKTNKANTQHIMCWKTLLANKYK